MFLSLIEFMALIIFPDISLRLVGSKRKANSPQLSLSDFELLATTGQPNDIASIIGMPKPSYNEG